MIGIENAGCINNETRQRLESTILELQEDFLDWWLFQAIDLLVAEENANHLGRESLARLPDEKLQAELAASVERFRGVCAAMARRAESSCYSSILERWPEAKGPRVQGSDFAAR